ncbi:methanesulfonate monooxygenase [Diplocarpon rosae]|nr:methanesulfonate monooxygenase [Diplocarpon rosae]
MPVKRQELPMVTTMLLLRMAMEPATSMDHTRPQRHTLTTTSTMLSSHIGFLVSLIRILNKLRWEYEYNVRYARIAEKFGFEYAFTQIRSMAGYGAISTSPTVRGSSLPAARKINTNPSLSPKLSSTPSRNSAKQIASIGHYTNGRIPVNVTTDKYTFKVDFYQFHDYSLSPKPLGLSGRSYQLIFQGGNSIDARENVAHIADARERVRNVDREGDVHFAVNGSAIVKEKEEEAIQLLSEIEGRADKEAIDG